MQQGLIYALVVLLLKRRFSILHYENILDSFAQIRKQNDKNAVRNYLPCTTLYQKKCSNDIAFAHYRFNFRLCDYTPNYKKM